MKQTQIIMGMPITINVLDKNIKQKNIDKIYDYFTYVDEKFSTYKNTSEISKINKGILQKNHYSSDMKTILMLCEKAKKETNGYFDILKNGKLDPSGIVKGWAIQNASDLLKKMGFKKFYVDAGGDIQTTMDIKEKSPWKVGIRNPFKFAEIVKVLLVKNKGIATSGTSVRGQHIYNPFKPNKRIDDIVSLTVIGSNIFDADRFATAAFAMGKQAIYFIEKLKGFEAYMINNKGIATYTSGFKQYIH